MDDKATEVERAIDLTTQKLAEKAWQAVKQATEGNFEGLIEIGIHVLTPALSALVIMAGFYFIAKYVSKLVSSPIHRRVDQTLGCFVEKLVYRGMIACGFIYVLHYFGVRSTSFAAVIAAAGFAIGLAFQGTLSNFASGILLMVFRPFKVGDMVVANGIAAKVFEIDLFTTAVDTPDNRRLIIPNSAIAGHTIENITYHPNRRIEVPVGVAYAADMDQTRSALQQSIASIAASVIENADQKSQVILVGLGASSVDWIVRVWAKTSDFSDVRDKLVYSIKTELDNAEIPIAFPQLDVHIDRMVSEISGHSEGLRAGPLRTGPKLVPRRNASGHSDAA
jgi:small conductance mechanosensitive channel